MSANAAREITVVYETTPGTWVAVIDHAEHPIAGLVRPELLKAAKVRFPETAGNRWFRVSSEEVVRAIATGQVPETVSNYDPTTEGPTAKQVALIAKLSAKAGRAVVNPTTKAEASQIIDALKAETTIPETTATTPEPTRAPEPTTTAAPLPTPEGGQVEQAIAALVAQLAPSLSQTPALDVDAVREIVADEISKATLPAVVEIREGQQVRTVDGHAHKVLPQVIAAVSRGYHVLLVGPAGTGKSTIAQQVYAALGHDGPIPSVSFGPTTPTSKLFGFCDATGTYNGTPFRDSWDRGCPFLADELDNGHPGLVAELNQALSNGSAAFADGQQAKREGWGVIATANTFGRGGDRLFVGRNQLDAATLDRFLVIEVDYDETLEHSLALGRVAETDRQQAEQIIATVRRHRSNVLEHRLPVVVSPRSVMAAVDLICNAGWTLEQALESCYLGGLSEDVRRKVTA